MHPKLKLNPWAIACLCAVCFIFVAADSVGPHVPSVFSRLVSTNKTADAWRGALSVPSAADLTTVSNAQVTTADNLVTVSNAQVTTAGDLVTVSNAQITTAANLVTVSNAQVTTDGKLTGYVTNNAGTATNAALTGGTVTSQTNLDLTASRVVVSDANKVPTSSSVTTTTLALLDATSSVQTQLDSKPTVALTNVALLNGANNFNGSNSFASLTYSPALLGYESGSNIVVDATRTLSYVTLTNTTYFAAASNFSHGASVVIVLQQDATGGRAVTFDTNFWKFPGGFVPAITTNANAIDVLSAVASPFSTNFLSVQTPNLQ